MCGALWASIDTLQMPIGREGSPPSSFQPHHPDEDVMTGLNKMSRSSVRGGEKTCLFPLIYGDPCPGRLSNPRSRSDYTDRILLFNCKQEIRIDKILDPPAVKKRENGASSRGELTAGSGDHSPPQVEMRKIFPGNGTGISRRSMAADALGMKWMVPVGEGGQSSLRKDLWTKMFYINTSIS